MTIFTKSDNKIFELIEKEKIRQENEIELIASENYVSKAVLKAIGSCLTNKYSEGYPGKRYYAGQEYIDQIEQLAIDRAKQLFGAEYVNVQPLSGSPANLAVYLALLQPGDTILSLSLDQGGHLSHGHKLNFSGLLYNIISYHLNRETELIDMDEVENLALKYKPKMIIAGFSAYPRNLDWEKFREIADKVGAILMSDISHIAGLVAGKALENPVPYCDIVTTTTHKTLRGPRGAIIMSKNKFKNQISRAVFPGVQGGPHENLIAAKAVAFYEALQPGFVDYAKQVVKNAKVMAEMLNKLGYKLVTNGTDNHLVLIDIFNSKNVTGKEAEKALEIAGISTNKNMIPYDKRKPMDPSGLRLGTPAVTTRGMKENEMIEIVTLFDQVINLVVVYKEKYSNNLDLSQMKIFENMELIKKLLEIKQKILTLCKSFPIYN